MLAGKRILLIIGGGIAAYKALDLIRRLRERGASVTPVMTRAAGEFVTPLSVAALAGETVHSDLFDLTAEAEMGHIQLSRVADLIVVAPATADLLAKMAQGRADDLASTLLLATDTKVLVAPAMNQQMWANRITQRNLDTLRDFGFTVLEPDSGEQACGDVGAGRMPEPEDLVRSVQAFLQAQVVALPTELTPVPTPALPQSLAGQHVVITAGPTREALDPVRYLSNHSTGKMGFALAEACRDAGATVTLLAGPVHLPTPQGIERINITSARDLLAESLRLIEQGCAVFIATAAVADYRPEVIEDHKIKKSGEITDIRLVKNPDVVATIAAHPQRPFVVGFAAETQNTESYAQGKLHNKKLDMIACNDVSRRDIGFGADENAMTVFFAEQYGLDAIRLDKASKADIAARLVACIGQAQQQKK